MRCLHAVRAMPAAFAMFLVSFSAAAQNTSDKAAAEALFDQGRAAMQRNDFAQACSLLERSQRIEPGIGTLLYLAECFEKSGRTASAWATFREAADAAAAARDAGRARTGRERAARLEPSLSRLTIQVSPENQSIAGLAIERRGQVIPPAVWNVPVPVDPGDYTVTAAAAGYEAWSGAVAVPERAAQATIIVPPLKKGPDAERTPPPGPAPDGKSPATTLGLEASAAPPSADRARPSDEPRGNAQRTFAYVIGGVGVVGLGLGSFFGFRAISKNGDAKDLCSTTQCGNAEGVDLGDQAKTSARISDVAFAVGAAALVGGAVLYFTAPHGERASSGVRLHAAVGPTSIGVGGAFQ